MADEDDPVGIDKTFRALQRTGPTLMLLASEIGAAGRGRAGDTGAFYIDPERAQECIGALRRVDFDLAEASAMAARARLVDPPGDDEVSRNLAVQAQIMSDHSFAFVQQWRVQIRATVEALEQQLRAYMGADAEGARRA